MARTLDIASRDATSGTVKSIREAVGPIDILVKMPVPPASSRRSSGEDNLLFRVRLAKAHSVSKINARVSLRQHTCHRLHMPGNTSFSNFVKSKIRRFQSFIGGAGRTSGSNAPSLWRPGADIRLSPYEEGHSYPRCSIVCFPGFLRGQLEERLP